MDNDDLSKSLRDATHKHPKVKTWLAKHPRYHIHFMLIYCSWLNQIETCFGLVTRQSIRRASIDREQAMRAPFKTPQE